jgi:hypothetical protein
VKGEEERNERNRRGHPRTVGISGVANASWEYQKEKSQR